MLALAVIDQNLQREIEGRASELRYPAEAIVEDAIRKGLRLVRPGDIDLVQRRPGVVRSDTAQTIVEKPPEKEKPKRIFSQGQTQLEYARSFLLAFLANGSVPSLEMVREAKAAGIKERTLWNAKKKLKIESKKGGFDGGWWWKLPEGCTKAARMA